MKKISLFGRSILTIVLLAIFATTTMAQTDSKQWANCWVEGIGGMYGLTDTYGWYIIGSTTRMQRCYVNDKCIFTYDDFFTKPVSGISNPIGLPSGKDDIYNLQGCRVTSPQKNGLYIKNGKKYIVH